MNSARCKGGRFCPLVYPDIHSPPASEEEEDEDKMADLIHNFGARKRKWGASFMQATYAFPKVVCEVDQQPTGRGSEERAIVVVDSPEIGFHGQSASKTMPTTYSREVPRTHEEVRESIPSGWITSLPDKATSSRSKRSRSLLPDQLLLYSYIPPQGPAPPMEEVSASRPEGAKEIINR